MAMRWLGLATFVLITAWTRLASAQYTTTPAPIVATDPVGGGGTSATGTLSEMSMPTVDLQLDAACTGFAVTPNDNVTLPAMITVTYTATARTPSNVSCLVHVKNMSGTGADLGTFTVQGRGIAPEITIVTTPQPITFGARRVLDTAASPTSTRSIRIQNLGDNLPVSISNITLGGTAGADYSIPTPPTFPVVLAQNAFVDVDVVFNPSVAGARAGQINVISNDPINPTRSASLSGSGTNATIRANDLDMGTVAVGTTQTSQIKVDNTATPNTGPLTISSATITQSSSWFSFAGTNGCTAGATMCTFSGLVANDATTMAALVDFRCNPPNGATGFQVATVTFASDTDAGATDNTAGITCTAGRADATLSPTSRAYGDQLLNTTSTAQTFTISNVGTTTLTYALALAGTDAAHFQFGGTPCTSGCTLAAGAITTVNVAFRPTTLGAKAAVLRVTSNDPDNPTIEANLSGTGVAPHAMPSATSLNFGTIEVGDVSASQTLTVMNTGTANLQITSATSQSAELEVPTGTLGAQTVAPGASASWAIRCRPSTHGSRNSTFRIVSNSDAMTGNLDIALNCSGNQGLLAANPTSHNFGPVAVGNTATRMFTITNNGNLPVNNVMAAFSDATAGYAVVSPSLPIAQIAGNGGSVTITVRFAPVDANSGGPVTLTLSGAWGTSKTASAQISLDGDGQSTGFDVGPAAVAFGDFRWDTTVDRTVCVQNNSQATFNVTSIALMNVMMAGEISIVSIRRTNDCATPSASAIVTLPQALTQNQKLEVIVRADPANRTGALSGNLVVTSDLAANPMRTVGMTGNSTSPALTNDPGGTLDFGAVDLQAGPTTRTLTITNSGNGPMNIGAITRTPASGGPFTLSPALPAARVVAPGENLTFTVTYTPTTEGAADTLTLQHTIAGILNGPTMNMLTITGRGIDRHLGLAPAPAFPETFRNPGSMAPAMPVTVSNTGEATLRIAAVMLSGSPVWQLAGGGDPIDIPGGGSHDFQVRFLPTEAGAAPQGTLVLMNDDDQQPMATVNLDGVGKLRDVTLGEGVPINLGDTAIGVPITELAILPVVNRDAANAFTIARIELADASALRIVAPPEGEALEAAATNRYDLTFTPEAEGDFETMAVLYLDEDPVPTATVPIRGRAVFVDLGGGGGCATGRGTGGALVLVLGALLLGRNRRRKQTAAATVLAACLLVPAAARAQATDVSFDLDLSLFDPTPSTTGYRFQIEPATVGKHGDWVAAATASIATNPLVMRQSGGEHMTISRITTMELGGAYAFLDRFEAGLRLPLYSQDGDGTMLGVPSPTGTARGDLVAHGRAQLVKTKLGTGDFAAGASLALTLPTATGAQFAGVDKPTARVLGLATLAPSAARKRMTFTANLGAIVRAKTQVANIEQGSGLAWGAGTSFRVLDKLWATGELYGDYLFGARRPSAMAAAENMMVAEWLFGVSYRPDPRVAVGVALGRGLTSGLGAPELRGVFALTYAPGTEKLPPIYPPPPPKIDGDEDGDGIKDSKDKCPEDPEDFDGFQDDDGCPDSDNDSDTYTDSNDKCPNEKEDIDGFQDDDGCPDPDNDGDGIPDEKDRCPNKPEDFDGFKDDDGCPDLDNDGDGIPDEADKCPNDAEVINGNADDDGCPDRGDSLVIVTPSALDMLDTIQWSGARLAPASKNLLGQIAATLRAHPEIVRLKIVSHVNPSGDAQRDRELTEKRAIAIREWLIQWGIVPTRLSGQGLGGTKPLVPPAQKGAAQLNDRIELIILERK